MKMAGSEGSGQTELLSGWSCVVHRPSEDPEPSELPSTVDMAAFSSGLNVEPAQSLNDDNSCDSESDSDSDSNNSGSDVTESCSQTDSSDSESSSSSQGSSSRSSSPEFSVTSSQTNGLRLKIATVRKSCTSPVEKPKVYADAKQCDKKENSVVKGSNASSSSESRSKSSSGSSSESDVPSTSKSDSFCGKTAEKVIAPKKTVAKVRLKQVEKKPERRTTRSAVINSPKMMLRPKTRPRRARKMASLPLSRHSTGPSSESEDGSESDRTMLASCSLQEIRQEDLAAILPDQQECDAFGGFDCRPDKSSPRPGDGSGSDMELPQQAVNALIQRTTESSSESESRVPLNPNTLYANSLLQQFVAQTQMLNAPNATSSSDTSLPTPLHISTENTSATVDAENTKRKRGRPRKVGSHKILTDSKLDKTEPTKSISNLEYCGNPNVSPDSGIQNSPDHVSSSPEPSPIPSLKPKLFQSVESLQEKTRHISKSSGENKNVNSRSATKSSLNKIKEQPKLPITSNSFDRVLYGNADRVLYPPRRKVGRPPITRKGPGRPPKHKPVIINSVEEVKPPNTEIVSNNEIKQNKAILRQSEKCENKFNKYKKNAEITSQTNNSNLIKVESKEPKPKDIQKKSKSALLHEICEKVSKRLDISNKSTQKGENKETKTQKLHKGVKASHKSITNRVVLGCKNKVDPLKAKYTTLKNSKVMHSKHKNKKHKKCKFKILKPITATLYDPKLNTEIDKLVADFVKLCNISSSKPAKENVPEMLKVLKKASKKRKASDYSERKKKKQNVTGSFNKETTSNEQRLPLKKRHYHLSTNDSGSACVQIDTETESKAKIITSAKDTKTPTISSKIITEKSKCVNKNIIVVDDGSVTTAIDLDIKDNKPNDISQSSNNLNNNDYTAKTETYITKSETVSTHIDEAIEACITKYASESRSIKTEVTSVSPEATLKNEKEKPTTRLSLATTTPKKRHRLELNNDKQELPVVSNIIAQISLDVEKPETTLKLSKNKNIECVSEHKTKKNLLLKPTEIEVIEPQEQNNETVAQIITRKKNRLEDLTLTLAHKVNSIVELDHYSQKCKKDVSKLAEEPVIVENNKRKKDIPKIDESSDNQKRKKDVLKVKDQDSNKRKKDIVKIEDGTDNQKRKKETTKVEPSTTIDDHKRKKETVKIEDSIEPQKHKRDIAEEPLTTETTSRRKKEIVKVEELGDNYKRKKYVTRIETPLTIDTNRSKKELPKIEQAVDSSQKRKKEVDLVNTDTGIRKRKEITKVEEPVVDNQKRKREVYKIDEEIGTDIQRRKKEIVKVETKEDNLKSREINKGVKSVGHQKLKMEEQLVNNAQNHKDSTKMIDTHRKKDNAKTDNLQSRASVIKSPLNKKTQLSETDKLDCMTADKPTGIFMPTVDIELQIPCSKIPTAHATDINLTMINKNVNADEQQTTTKDCGKIIENGKSKKILQSDIPKRRKVRKRRAINRTGFPTVKKKKKRVIIPDWTTEMEVGVLNKQESNEKSNCDRVPQDGEKYSAFLQRTEKFNVSNTILEKLQKTALSNTQYDQIPVWDPLDDEESMHELGVSRNGRPLSRLSSQRSSSKDVSPAASIETFSSDKLSKMSDDKESTCDLDDISLEARLALLKGSLVNKNCKMDGNCRKRSSLLRNEKSILYKQRLRDISPASSIEHFNERKLREEVSVSGDEAKRTRKAVRCRKKYLIAGLFSDYYKEDDEAVRLKRTEAATKSKIVYNPQEHPYGLLPAPYHCGRYIRCRKIPFQLPYDLWWQHTNSQLPGRDIVPSWNYRKIRTNVYNVKTTAGACEPQACNCGPTSGCGDDCINRLVLAECPATHKCQNQKIQKHEWAPGIEKFMTTNKGWGVRTKLPIKCSEFILEYVGEVVSDQEFKERMASRYAHDTHHYCLHLDGGLVIDGHRMGGDGRFVNHSCEPNCEMQKWSVNGQFRMALFALRDIEACEELAYDYNFSLFNPAEGQECKCGSTNCRGVIGGKSQRVRQSVSSTNSGNSNSHVGRVGRPRKNQAKRTTSGPKEPPAPLAPPPLAPMPLMKPMSNVQKLFVCEHHCFLLRNLNRAKQNRERSVCSISVTRANASTPTDHNATTFMNHLNALRQPRNMKTRRLAQVEDNPELKKTAALASILRDLLNIVTTTKDENNELLCTTFMNLPSKRKIPEYYQRITEPIDLTTIENNIGTGNYRSVENFDADMNKIFINAVRFFGRTSEPGIAATRLKKIYGESKQQSLSKLEEVIGEKLPPTFVSNKRKGEEEDVIRCICGMFRDEGLMIQCERCLVWQHCECVQADVAAASYHCERCVPRDVDYEIALDEYTEHGHQYFMTLLREDLQLRQGDTVYVLRDIPIPGTDRKHTYKTISEVKYADMDIFRIERLWKDKQSGKRFAYGHHYLRPHETFHEPTRKFFSNEVMRVPLYEAVPVELVISHCWVLDINTFCKGRPIGAPEEHIYICEYRVDKSARLFSKISKTKYSICTKSYAFERFDVRLKISRTYTPHDLDPVYVKPRGRKPHEIEDVRELPQMPVHVPVIRTPSEKKTRLNEILLTLLNKLPSKQALDVSYLLEGGRRRKKHFEK